MSLLLQLLLEQHANLIEESARLRQQADHLMTAIAPHLIQLTQPSPTPATQTTTTRLPLHIFTQPSRSSSHLTPEQVEQVSRLIRFGDIESPLNTVCPISLETFTPDSHVRQLTCRHAFYQNQIDNWFTRNTRCPTCRHDFLQDVTPTARTTDAGIEEMSFILSGGSGENNIADITELMRMMLSRH